MPVVKTSEADRIILQVQNELAERKLYKPKASKPSQPRKHTGAVPVSVGLTELEYRDIAKMFQKALPLDGSEYKTAVDDCLAQIKALPRSAQLALRSAYIFGSKAPREDREDLFQSLALAVLQKQVDDERLAYAIARCDWLDWWQSHYAKNELTCVYHGRPIPRHHDTCHMVDKPDSCKRCAYAAVTPVERSTNATVDDGDGNTVEYGELLIGEAEFDNKMDGQLDGQRLYDSLPDWIKAIVDKRLRGESVTGGERHLLDKWVLTRPTCLASYVN